MKQDIQNLEDVKLLVNTFYDHIREDALLKNIFNERIEDRWPAHLEKMYRFWQTVLLEEHTYYGSPFVPHANMPVVKEHFEQWLKIFNATVDNLFEGDRADKAKWQGERMAIMFNSKINHYKANPTQEIL